MKKRFLNLFLALALAVLVLPMAADAAEECTHKSGKTYTVENIAAKPATCTEDGNDAYIACTSCGQALKKQGSKYIEVEKPVLDALGHNITNTNPTYLKETITEPTCQTPGRGKYGCSREGCKAWSKLDIPVVACEAQSVAKVEPTCTTPGKHAGTSCKWCGKVMSGQGTIKALGHTEEEIPAVAPTCTTKGATVGVKCSVCDEVLTEPEEIAANGHHFTVFKDYNSDRAVRPTCETAGKARYGCEDCNAWSLQPVAALGHARQGLSEVAPTCGTPGKTAGTWCWRCEKVFNGMEEIPATGQHTYTNSKVEVLAAATCTEAKKVRYTCDVCETPYDTTTGQPNDHAWDEGTVTREATCQKAGSIKFKCTVDGCKGTKTESIAKLTCNIVETEAVAPTCEGKGKTAGIKCTSCKVDGKYTCAYCKANMVPQQYIDATGHKYEFYSWLYADKPATCTNAGWAVDKCTVCNATTNRIVEAYGHDKDITVLKEATCTEDGRQYFECKRCAHYQLETIPNKGGHTEEIVPEIPATCTATGLSEGKKCSVCGETLDPQVVTDKLPHAWKDVEAKAATCQEDGYNAHRACANCGETDGMTVIPANNTGHNYVNNKCTICGEYDPAHEHQGTGTVTTDSTCTTKGVKSFSCSGCDYTWTEDIAKKAHSYGADDRCTVCQKLNSKHEHSYAQTDYREPTCDIGGQVTKQCSVCGDTTQTTINALGHSYSNGRCIRCGTAAACTHSTTNTTVTREATCKRAGEKVTSCTGCGKVMGTESIPATGNHNYVNDYCTGCGQVDPYKKTADNQDVYPLG